MKILKEYKSIVNDKLEQIIASQTPIIEDIIKIVYDTLLQNKIIHLFGSGHSHALAEEFFYRAGGLISINAILEEALMVHVSAVASSQMERLPNYAPIILSKYSIQKGDILFIFSNSGINTVSIDMAIEAKKMGVKVISLTSKKHSDSQLSRHESGLRLYEVSDLYIDTMVDPGDASITMSSGKKIGPISTIVSETLMHGIFAEAAVMLDEEGFDVPVYISANVADGDESNKNALAAYRDRIRHL